MARVHVARLHTAATAARPAHCLAIQPESNLLALSRDDGSIEIWNVLGCPVIVRQIAACQDGSVEALCWAGSRLFSAGLSRAVVEWDLRLLEPRRSVITTGHAVWCLDIAHKSSKLAACTEQGYVNIYSIENDDINYERIFDKQQGRILCCKFDPSGKILVTGSIETIRIWDVSSGQALHRMSTGRAERNKETIVWSLAVTSDLTIISGDSRGCLTFWDAHMGEQIESLNTHKADILSVCLSEDQNSLFCAGVDPLIVKYSKVKMKHKGGTGEIEKWVKNIQRNIHQHDVRAMVTFDNKLFSAGVDGYLAMSSFPPKVLVKYLPIDASSSAAFCNNSNIICVKNTNNLELWQLGSAKIDQKGNYTSDNQIDYVDNSKTIDENKSERETYENNQNATSGKRLQIVVGPKFLLRLTTQSEAPIVCYAISPSKKWIAYSTESHFRIFKFTMVDDSPTLSRLVPLPNECAPCYKMCFSPDSNKLIISSANSILRIIYIHKDGAIMVGCDIDASETLKDSTLTHLSTYEKNNNSFYLVAADSTSNICVWEVDNSKPNNIPKVVAQLPQYSYPPTAITVDKKENNILICYSDQKLIEYNLTSLQYTDWSKSLSDQSTLGNSWWGKVFPTVGLEVHPKLPHIIMAWDDCGIYVFNKNAQNDEDLERAKRPKTVKPHKDRKTCFITHKYKHLVGAGWVYSENKDVDLALLLIEPMSILENLPSMFHKKRFGCM